MVFVTGGSGFLGRALIREFVARGCKVRALARSDAAREAVRLAGAQPIAGGLHSQEALERGCDGVAVVFHCAAIADDWGTREQFDQVNVVGTRNVLAALGGARMVHVSTESVLLGGGPIIRATEERPIARKPIGLYAWSKGLAEEAVREAVRDRGADAVIVRPRLIWGADDTTLLPRLIESVRKHQFRWIGGGRHLTSTCHVDNVVEGMCLAATKGRAGEAYFLTDGEPIVFRTFVSQMLLARGVNPPRGSLPRGLAKVLAAGLEWIFSTFLPGAPPLTRMVVALFGEEVTVDDGKARRELGYEGTVTPADGLAAMVTTA
ncbi:MAG: NAD-dependent epimerase/dehydratase family protein [Proteobacteria bacterium]|nr:NAD-dependent epimerase/dehydratase family protein [Pseudomonadota bacterium]